MHRALIKAILPAKQRERAESRRKEIQEKLAETQTERIDPDELRALMGSVKQLWNRMEPIEKREVLRELIDRIDMFDEHEEGATRLVIKFVFGHAAEVRVPRLWRVCSKSDQPSGVAQLTPRQKAALLLWGRYRDKHRIAKQMGIQWAAVNSMLWAARKKLGAETLDEAYEAAKEHLVELEPWLPLEGRAKHLRGMGLERLKRDLADQQRLIIEELAAGLKPAQIAADMALSVNTVDVHLRNIRRRLACATNSQALQNLSTRA